MAEDILSSLQCMHVSQVELGDYYFAIEGWVPQEWFDELRDITEEVAEGRMTVVWDESEAPITTRPVLLQNPRVLRPFQQLVELFSLPGNAGFDPTFLTFLTLPLFFGFMIGDWGYGLVFIGAGLVIRRYFTTPLAELASLLLFFGGAWSLLFGTVFFGDFFGFHLDVPYLDFHLLNKLEDLTTLLLLSLVMGLIHVNVGLVAAFLYGRRRVGLRVAALKRLSWLVVQAGGILLILSLFGILLDVLWIPATAVTVVGIALVTLGGGVTSIIELPRLVGNVLSYLRLGIIAVAKGALGAAVNAIAVGQLLTLGLVGAMAGGLLLVVGHGFLMVLALLIVGVHALRLHYVEFYTQFYDMEEMEKDVRFEPLETLSRIEEARAT